METKYREPVGIEQPSDESTIWNYMSFCNFERLMESAEMYLAKMSGFSDFQEGLSTEPDFNEMAQSLEPLSGEMQRDEQIQFASMMEHIMASSTKADHYVYCWSLSSYEANLMWRTYGNACKADGDQFNFKVAIKSTVGRLKVAIKHFDDEVAIGRVRYIDARSDSSFIDGDDTHESRRVFTKSVEYRDEHELRISINSNDFFNDGRLEKPIEFNSLGGTATLIGWNMLDKLSDKACIMVTVELPELLDEVYIEAVRDFDEMKRRKNLVENLLSSAGCSSVVVRESYIL